MGKTLEPYPARTFWKRLLDRVVLALSVAAPVLTIPQAMDIYTTRDASGVSAITWGAYTLFAFPWLLYGIVHKEPPIIVSNILWIILDSLVFIGVLLYG